MTYDRRNVLVTAIATTIISLAFIFGLCEVGARATEADRDFRARKAEACTSIEDDELLALCVIGGRG